MSIAIRSEFAAPAAKLIFSAPHRAAQIKALGQTNCLPRIFPFSTPRHGARVRKYILDAVAVLGSFDTPQNDLGLLSHCSLGKADIPSCKERIMDLLWTIGIILLVLWLLGLVTSYTLGGFIHVLLVLAVIVILIRVIQGRRPIP
jgi:hypothetical protein